ncbi:hypothetical protein [Staphylococcus aureus]|uniref:hypothetical protein n=1 Tax=Staphylococcus aureus TaxID=1280 RepID=UPI00202ED59C|nr:hypothetical protein [Staphylococcus aureus]MCM0417899.1 hypothetical protein [Staphylococcus aureus]
MCIKKSRKFYLPTIKDEEPNLSMYSRFDMPKFGCVNGCMLFILYYRVNRIGENRNFEIFTNSIFFIEIKKANKALETLLA